MKSLPDSLQQDADSTLLKEKKKLELSTRIGYYFENVMTICYRPEKADGVSRDGVSII